MLEVRAARHGDAPALDALGAAPEAGVFVLEKNGAVIGALTLRAGEIFGCAVAPEWRGRGYGTFLLRPGGVMTVCVYYGGPQGMAEKDAVLAFLTGLPPEGYRVSVRDFSGRPGCPPIPVCIEKRAW